MPDFITSTTNMPAFLMFPRFILDTDINETGKLMYMVLLDRARLSMKNDGWTDKDGHVFIVFPIEKLEQVLHKGERTIRRCLDNLAKHGLIQRRHQGVGKADIIYVKLPSCQECPPKADTDDLSERSEMTALGGRKCPGSNNESITKESERENKSIPTAYGAYGNVLLTDEEYADLRCRVSGCDSYIEKLSGYMAYTGRRYQSHHATIRSWASRDGKLSTRTRYECKEDESL